MKDLDALRERLAARLGEAAGQPVEVRALKPLVGGACQDNFRVEVTVGGVTRTLALRSDALTSLPGSIGREQEYAVIRAAVEAGVRTPAVRWLTDGLVRDGAHGYLMDWVEGEAIGARVTRSPELAAAREGLPDQLSEALARIHSITPASHPALPISRPPMLPDADPAEAAIGFVSRLLDRLPAPRPACELALRWLRERRPPRAAVTLVHGDFRTGNFLVGPDGLGAVLDWEFAHWGDPVEDIGWLCTRDWRFGEVHLPVGGFAPRARFYRAYAAAAGRDLDPARVHYWEVFGNVRWGAATAMQGLRYAQGQRDLELLAIPRRAAEMEYEALRLIEVGPPEV